MIRKGIQIKRIAGQTFLFHNQVPTLAHKVGASSLPPPFLSPSLPKGREVTYPIRVAGIPRKQELNVQGAASISLPFSLSLSVTPIGLTLRQAHSLLQHAESGLPLGERFTAWYGPALPAMGWVNSVQGQGIRKPTWPQSYSVIPNQVS